MNTLIEQDTSTNHGFAGKKVSNPDPIVAAQETSVIVEIMAVRMSDPKAIEPVFRSCLFFADSSKRPSSRILPIMKYVNQGSNG
tara:strand:- start:406 stop:657 length:252 start_codon:yes stop_codon:yes gene_type:complete